MPNKPHIYWDSDVVKWIEGAAYFLLKQKDEKLEAKVDDLVGVWRSSSGRTAI